MDFHAKVVIVTGSATGVGAACAWLPPHAARASSSTTATSAHEAQATAQACRDAGGEAIVVQADVAKDVDCRRLAQAAFRRMGPHRRRLVNNAGNDAVRRPARPDGPSADDFQRIYAVNVVGAFQMARRLRRGATMPRGAIVNVRRARRTTAPFEPAYACSGALNTLTIALAKRARPLRCARQCRAARADRFALAARGLGESAVRAGRDGLQRRSRRSRIILTPEDVAESIVALFAMPRRPASG